MKGIQAEMEGIYLVPVSKNVETEVMRALFPNRKIVVCDAYVADIEKIGRSIAGGFALDEDIINIDHHAPAVEMERPISSTPLAIEYMQAFGSISKDAVVVINHMDADSMLSSAVMRGLIEPEERFGEAAIAADHTGADNELADLLQGCGQARDLEFSYRNLKLWLAGQPIETKAQELLDKQRLQRAEAKKLVDEGKFTVTESGLAWIYVEDKIDGAFSPALLPEAKVILQFSPIDGGARHRVGHRLGLAAPAGMTLHKLGVDTFDKAFGGRWNAGNNSRAGGTEIAMEAYVAEVDKRFGVLRANS